MIVHRMNLENDPKIDESVVIHERGGVVPCISLRGWIPIRTDAWYS